MLEELLTTETITNLCYNSTEGKKIMITLKDGSQGFQREDGKFETSLFSSNGKFSGMKTITGQLQVPNVKREDTSASLYKGGLIND